MCTFYLVVPDPVTQTLYYYYPHFTVKNIKTTYALVVRIAALFWGSNTQFSHYNHLCLPRTEQIVLKKPKEVVGEVFQFYIGPKENLRLNQSKIF